MGTWNATISPHIASRPVPPVCRRPHRTNHNAVRPDATAVAAAQRRPPVQHRLCVGDRLHSVLRSLHPAVIASALSFPGTFVPYTNTEASQVLHTILIA